MELKSTEVRSERSSLGRYLLLACPALLLRAFLARIALPAIALLVALFSSPVVQAQAITAFSASDGTIVGTVRISYTYSLPNEGAACTYSKQILRNGTFLANVSAATGGGSGTYDDTTAVPGTTYTYRLVLTFLLGGYQNCGGQWDEFSDDTGWALGVPYAPSAVSASDGVYTDRVRVTYTAPDQSDQCTSISYSILRNGTVIGSDNLTTLTGGAGSYDDLTAVAGTTYNYAVRATCSPGGRTTTSATTPGWRALPVDVPTAVVASDGTYTDRVRVTFTAPNQTGSCSTIAYQILRNGSLIGTDNLTAITGGAGSFDDLSPLVGPQTYSVRASCSPSSQTATSTSDTGYVRGTPSAPTSVSATDGTLTDRVRVTWTAPNQSSECTSVAYDVLRDGTLIGNNVYTTLAGGAASWDDTTASPGVTYSYTVNVTCSPGSAVTTSTANTGFRSAVPTAPTAVSATDGQYPDRVTITWSQPAQTGCSSTLYEVLRDGVVIGSGSSSYDDTTAVPQTTYSYTVRATCSPGGNSATSTANTGFRAGTPTAATSVVASDGAYTDRVRISWTAPNQSANCTSVSYDVLRNGVVLGNGVYTALAGGAATWDDTLSSAGIIYTYSVRATCTPGSATATSATDTGFRLGTPSAVTSVSATDGTLTDRVNVTFTAPDQSSACASVTYDVLRDGVAIGTSSFTTLTGGSGSYTDLTATVGTFYNYAVRTNCSPGAATVTSVADQGFRAGPPLAVTTVSATDGTRTTDVRVTFTAPAQPAHCLSIDYQILRNGSLIGSSGFTTLTGGAGLYNDTTAVPNTTYSYAVRSVCTPGGLTADSAADNGFRAGLPIAPSALTASDGTFNDRVRLSFTAPDQSSQCVSISYVVVRDGSDIATITTIPLAGGAGSYDDMATPAGTHTYQLRAVCGPSNFTTTSATDDGFRLGTPLAPTSVAATDGTFQDRVRITWTSPDQSAQCSSVNYIIRRGGTDVATVTTVAVAGGASSYDDMTAPVGTSTYSVAAVCLPGSTTVAGGSDTGYKAPLPFTPTAVSASDGTFSTKVAVTFTAPDQAAACASVTYTVTMDGADVGVVPAVPNAGGTFTYDANAVAPGLHTFRVRANCALGSTSSLSVGDSGYQAYVPLAPSAVSASDFTFTDKVRVTFTAPDQSARCTGASYVISRDGTDIATLSSIPLAGQASAQYDDATAVAGTTYTYGVRSVCVPGSAVSAVVSDAGSRAAIPPTPTLTASDYTVDDRVNLSLTVPASPGCTSVSVILARDGTDIHTVPSFTSAGGTVNYDDVSPTFGAHTYSARLVCTPGSQASTSATDTGGRRGWPVAPSSVTASDNTFTDRVRVDLVVPASPQCTTRSVIIARGGTDITTITTVPIGGGTVSYDDMSAPYGAQSYAARSVCQPGATESAAVSDTGSRLSVAPAPTSISATDYVHLDRVAVTVVVPAASQCSSRDVVVRRDGTVVATVTTVPVAGGSFTYDDTAATMGVHTYSAESVCSPGGNVSSSISDSGAKRYPAATCSAVSAPATVFYPASPNAAVSITGVTDASLVRVRAWGSVGGTNDQTYYTATGGPSTYGASVVLDNHASGSPEYGTINLEARVTGRNPGDTEIACATTTFVMATPPVPQSVSASDFTLTDRVRITATIPPAPGCTSVSVQFLRLSTVLSTQVLGAVASSTPVTYDDIGGPTGIYSYGVRTSCTNGADTSTGATFNDDGARSYGPPICPSVTVPQPKFVYSNSLLIPVSAINPTNFSSMRFTAYGSAGGTNDLTSYSMAANGSNQEGSLALANHASGTPEYGVMNVTLYATGRDPGATEQMCSTTTFEVIQGCGAMTLTGPSGTGPLPSTVSWNSDPIATQYVLQRSTGSTGPWTDVGTYAAGTTSASVPGWPAVYYRVQCVAPDVMGNSTSPATYVFGNPPPQIGPLTFDAPNPGTTLAQPMVVDPDGNTTFTLAVVTQPANGTATVAGSNISYTPNTGFTGNDPFTISATDPGGASGTAVLTARVVPLAPSVPQNVLASYGTLLNVVNLTWSSSTYATGYKVYRGTSASDPSPVLLTSLATTSYTDTSVAPGVIYYYTVSAVNGPLESARSASSAGFADTPISALSWTVTTLFDTPVDAVPTYTDPDPGDTPTFAIATQPSNGTASVVAGKVRYAPNASFVGSDTFTITATDRAGASTTGTANITVNCPAPTVSSPSAAPSRIFASAGYAATFNYSTGGCPQPSTVRFDLLDSTGTQVLDTQTVAASAAAGTQTARFDRSAPATPGTYTIRMTLTNTVTSQSMQRVSSVLVNAFKPPVLDWSATPYLQSVDTALLRVTASSDCVVTSDPAVAASDTSKCLVEPFALPPGVAGGPQTLSVVFSGVPSAAGSFSSGVSVSMYSPTGTKQLLATVNAPIDVLPLSSLVFAASQPASTRLFTETYSAIPSQSAGPDCALTTAQNAQQLSISGRRGCVVDWAPRPTDSYQDGNTLRGVHFSDTPATATWTVSVVDASGTKHPASTGTVTLTPKPTSMAFDVSTTPAAPYALLTNAILTARSTGDDTCTVTGLESDALRLAPRLCLIEFGSVPGMTADANAYTPTMRGVFPTDGVVNIPWTASVMFQGVKRQIMSGTSPITVLAPQSPTLVIDRGREIEPDTFAVPVTGGFIGMLNSATTMGQVNGTYTVTGEDTASFFLLGNRSRQPLVAAASTLYSSRTVQVDLSLAASPTLATSKTVTVIAVPRDGLRLRLTAPAVATDTEPMQISATVVQLTPDGLRYVAQDAGQWSVVFGEASSSGAFIPLAGPILTNQDGTASASIPLTGRLNIRLQARATPVSPYPAYSPTLNSNMGVVSVAKGTSIQGTLSSSNGLTGPSPFLSAFKVVFNTFADHLFNDRYTWFTSNNGGSSWEQVPVADGPQFSLRFTTGTTLVKVRFRNKATLEESETPPLAVDAYNVPKILISGPAYLYPTNTGSYTLRAVDASGAPYPSPVFDWTITQYGAPSGTPPLATGNSTSLDFVPPSPGIFRLNVRARDASTSASDPKAWVQNVYQFVAITTAPVSVTIAGPIRAEVGKPYTWTANTQPSFDISRTNLSVGGQWTLPDGTVVPGPTLTWTPNPNDIALSTRPILKYTGWVTGYEDTTSFTKTFQTTLWQYSWPTWRLTKTQTSTMAPANVQYLVLPDNNTSLPILEGLTYTWNVPPSVVVSGTPSSKMTGSIATAADALLSVTVSDARGNSQTLTDQLSVSDPPPLVLDVTPQNLSKWSHAPLTLGVTAKVTGGNPLDPVALWEYFLDGTKLVAANTYTARIPLTNPGVYGIEVRATTRNGAIVTRSLTATAPANVPATCAPSVVLASNRRNMSVTANCVDPDGSIVKYQWTLNGVPLSSSLGANFSYVLPLNQVFPANLELTVTDDGAATSTSSVSIN